MIYLLSLLAFFIISDGLLTHALVGDGLREGNPLLVPLVAQGNLMVLKLVGTVVCIIILWDLYRRFPKLALITTSCFVVAYGVIVLWNFGLFLSMGIVLPAWLASSPRKGLLGPR
jgi:intracellular septation protein A